MTRPQKLRALAADLEDVLLRFRGHDDDAETLRRVADDLLVEAFAEEQTETGPFAKVTR